MASSIITLGSSVIFHDVEGFIAGLTGSIHGIKAACAFDQEKYLFTITCAASEKDTVAELALKYFAEYSHSEQESTSIFDDVFEMPKLSNVDSIALNEGLEEMYEDVDHDFMKLQDHDGGTTLQLIEHLKVRHTREIAPHMVKRLLTNNYVHELERVTNTGLELFGCTLIVTTDSSEKVDALLQKLDRCEKATNRRLTSKHTYDLLLRSHDASIQPRFKSASFKQDVNSSSKPYRPTEFLKLVAVKWDDCSRQHVPAVWERESVTLHTPSGLWPVCFNFRYGEVPDSAMSRFASQSQISKSDRIGLWRCQVATPAGGTANMPSILDMPIPSYSTSPSTTQPLTPTHLSERSAFLECDGVPMSVTDDISQSLTTASPLEPEQDLILLDGTASPAFATSLGSKTADSASTDTFEGHLLDFQDCELQNISKRGLLKNEGLLQPRNFSFVSINAEVIASCREILQVAKGVHASKVVLEASIGRIFTYRNTVPERWRPQGIRPGNPFKSRDWHKIFHMLKGIGNADTRFSPRIIDAETDASYLLSLLEEARAEKASGLASFNLECRDNRDGHRVMLVVEEGKAVQVQEPADKIGSVNIHVPESAWDARISVKGRRPVHDGLSPAFQKVVDGIWAQGPERPPDFNKPVIGSNIDLPLTIESGFLKRSASFTLGSDRFRHIAVDIEQKQRLRIEHTERRFYGYLSEEVDMRRESRMWWKLSFRSTAIDEILGVNEYLEIGEEAEYARMELFDNECKTITELLQCFVTRMNGIRGDPDSQELPLTFRSSSVAHDSAVSWGENEIAAA